MQLGQEKKYGMSDSLTPVHGKSHHVLQASHCIQVDPSSSSFPYTNPHIVHSPSLSVLLVLSNRDSFCRCFLRISTPLEALCLVLRVDLFVTFEALPLFFFLPFSSFCSFFFSLAIFSSSFPFISNRTSSSVMHVALKCIAFFFFVVYQHELLVQEEQVFH